MEQVATIYENPQYQKAKEYFQCDRLDYFYELAIEEQQKRQESQPVEIPDEIKNKVNNPDSDSIKEEYEKAENERQKVQ